MNKIAPEKREPELQLWRYLDQGVRVTVRIDIIVRQGEKKVRRHHEPDGKLMAFVKAYFVMAHRCEHDSPALYCAHLFHELSRDEAMQAVESFIEIATLAVPDLTPSLTPGQLFQAVCRRVRLGKGIVPQWAQEQGAL